MKTIGKVSYSFLTIAIICFNAITNAQTNPDLECGTTITPEEDAYLDNLIPQLKKYEEEYYGLIGNSKRGIFGTDRTSEALTAIPVKAHIIRNNDGSGGLDLVDLYQGIEDANEVYASIFVEFYLCGDINYIDDSVYYDYQIEEEEDDLTDAHYVDGVVNIYFTGSIYRTSNDSYLAGNANNPSSSLDVITMNNTYVANGTTFIHEIGHFFGLRHTHHDNNELVNGSNCEVSGDRICDTPADPLLSNSVVDTDCLYTGDAVDANGDFYSPSTINFMSYSRKYCRYEFTLQQLARMYAIFMVARNDFICPSFNASITSDISESCLPEGTTVNFTDTSIGAINWSWDVNGDDVEDYTIQNPSHTFDSDGVYDVALTISNGIDTITKVYPGYVAIGSQKSIPYAESFDDFYGANSDGWKALDIDSVGYNWFVNSGATPSSVSTSGAPATGPLADNSGDAEGVYIYAEATEAHSGDVAHYISPCVWINSSNAVLSFAYHMFASNDDMGELHIDINSGGVWINDVVPVISGSQQIGQEDPYLTMTIDLSTYAFETINVRFRAIRGSGWRSDIAIDDIQFNGAVLNVNELDSETLTFYPNPATNNVFFTSEYINKDYEIYSLLGSMVQQGAITSSVDVSDLAPGTYILKVIKNNNVLAKKLIIE